MIKPRHVATLSATKTRKVQASTGDSGMWRTDGAMAAARGGRAASALLAGGCALFLLLLTPPPLLLAVVQACLRLQGKLGGVGGGRAREIAAR